MAQKKLNTKQRLFALEYLIDRNATQAAIRAGYSKKTAHSQGPRLLEHVGVKALIQEQTKDREKRLVYDADRVLLEVARIALADGRQFYNEDGTLKKPHELDDDAAAVLSGAQISYRPSDDPDDPTPVKVEKLKLWNKNAALKDLMRHHGLYEVDNNQKTGQIAELLAEIAESQGNNSVLDKARARSKT